MEKLSQKFYSIADAAELLSLPVEEVHRLVGDEGTLKKCVTIPAESILEFAKRKGIEVRQTKAA